MSEDECIEFDGTLEPQNFRELTIAAARRAQRRRSWRSALLLAALLSGTTLALTMLADRLEGAHAGRTPIGAADMAPIGVLAGFLLTMVWISITSRSVSTAYLRSEGSLLGPRRYTVDGEGVHVHGPHQRAFSGWRLFSDVQVGRHTVMLWTDPGAAVVIPRNAFPDEAALDAFVAFCRRRIDQSQVDRAG